MAGRWLPEHEEWGSRRVKDALHDDYVEVQKAGIDCRSTQTVEPRHVHRENFAVEVQT